MQTVAIEMDRSKARDLYRAYKKHLHYSRPIDRECMRAYQLLAQGRLIIKPLESIVAAGLDDRGLPKLALCRADALACQVAVRSDGSAVMSSESEDAFWRRSNASPRKWIDFPRGSFAARSGLDRRGQALVPAPPLHLRPKRGLANYDILWEAEWTKLPPRDPYLLRRIGKSAMWLVVAMWDLTEVERAALATRIS